MPPPRRLLLLVVVVTAALVPAAEAQRLDGGADADESVKVYDVRDLVIDVPDFNDAPEIGVVERPNPAPARAAPGEPPGEPPGPNGRSRRALTDELVRLLRLRNPPAERDGQLVVRATPKEHAAAARTLEQLRERRRTQVSVEAVLVRLGEDKLARLEKTDPGLARKLRLATFRGGDRAGTVLSPEEAERLTPEQITCPRVTLFNGQRAYVLVVNQRNFVADVQPREGAADDGDAAFDPVVKTVEPGVVLDVTATAAAAPSVALHGRLQHVTLHAMREAPAPGRAPEERLVVQVPDYEKEVVSINAVVPHRVHVLFGVTETERPNAPQGDVGKRGHDGPLVAVVRATVIRRGPVN